MCDRVTVYGCYLKATLAGSSDLLLSEAAEVLDRPQTGEEESTDPLVININQLRSN